MFSAIPWPPTATHLPTPKLIYCLGLKAAAPSYCVLSPLTQLRRVEPGLATRPPPELAAEDQIPAHQAEPESDSFASIKLHPLWTRVTCRSIGGGTADDPHGPPPCPRKLCRRRPHVARKSNVVSATRKVDLLAVPRRPPAPIAPACLRMTSASPASQAKVSMTSGGRQASAVRHAASRVAKRPRRIAPGAFWALRERALRPVAETQAYQAENCAVRRSSLRSARALADRLPSHRTPTISWHTRASCDFFHHITVSGKPALVSRSYTYRP